MGFAYPGTRQSSLSVARGGCAASHEPDRRNHRTACRGLRPIIVQSKPLPLKLSTPWLISGAGEKSHEKSVKRSTAIIENIAPPTERDLGGVIVYLVEVKFRPDEQDEESPKAPQASFEELKKGWGV